MHASMHVQLINDLFFFEQIDTKHHSLKLSIQSLADPPQISPALVGGRQAGEANINNIYIYIYYACMYSFLYTSNN